MAGKKPTHTASMMYDEKDQNGEMKTRFHEICPIWENDNGNMFLKIPKGMLISGTVIITKNKERDQAARSNTQEVDVGDPDLDLPF